MNLILKEGNKPRMVLRIKLTLLTDHTYVLSQCSAKIFKRQIRLVVPPK